MPAPRWLATTPLQLRAAIGENATFAPLAGVLCATMPLPREVAQAAEERWRVPVHEIYGCTEAGTVALRRSASETRWHACEGLRVWRKAGDAWAAGGHLDDALKLPDRVEIVSEQEFILIGRPGDMIKIAGKRASLEALNCELLRIPGVRDGVCFLAGSGRRGRAARGGARGGARAQAGSDSARAARAHRPRVPAAAIAHSGCAAAQLRRASWRAKGCSRLRVRRSPANGGARDRRVHRRGRNQRPASGARRSFPRQSRRSRRGDPGTRLPGVQAGP